MEGVKHMQPKHRRWIVIAVIYDTSRVLHLDALRDSILAAVVAKVLDARKRR